jgi:hypothetical protein
MLTPWILHAHKSRPFGLSLLSCVVSSGCPEEKCWTYRSCWAYQPRGRNDLEFRCVVAYAKATCSSVSDNESDIEKVGQATG